MAIVVLHFIMKTFILIFFAITAFSCSQESFKSDFPRYWVTKDIDWRHPNTGVAEIDSMYENHNDIASTIFHENGKFVMTTTNGGFDDETDTIYQHVEIGHLYTGTWKRISESTVEIRYKLTQRMFPRKNDDLAWRIAKVSVLNNEIDIGRHRLIPANLLSTGNKAKLKRFAVTDFKKFEKYSN
jgi:hypothetical protein